MHLSFYTFSFYILALFLLLLLLKAILNFLVSHRKDNKITKFHKSLRVAIENGPPQWKIIERIAETNSLSKNDLWIVLNQALSDSWITRDDILNTNRKIIESYIDCYEKTYPFEGVPDEFKNLLTILQKKVSNETQLIKPLVNYLRKYTSKKLIDQKQQKIVSIISLIVGVMGFLITLYPIM